MPYSDKEYKVSNVNYLNKDFSSFKNTLMEYAKTYFPNTYRDFNETSPGMMLLEMNAYVGDVLSFYIDQQYREMLLPLAEERRNIINMAKMFGYKVKPIVPAYVDLTFTSEVNALSDDRSKVDYSNGGVWNPGIEIVSSTNQNIIFSTLEHIDFRITSSLNNDDPQDGETIGQSEASGLASTYTLTRSVRAVSATQKTITFQIAAPEKFKTLTIPDTNVVDIVSCVDSNGNDWYEVDFLAQDKVPIATHYTDDVNRDSATADSQGLSLSTAVPFSLTYITTPKRFTRETNVDNTTSLVFGNGILRVGADGNVDQGYIDMEQVGVVVPGQQGDLNSSIDPLLGNEYASLGEAPNNVTLTITYRVGGGVDSNVPAGDISTTPTNLANSGNVAASLTSVVNNRPAVGGRNQEDTLEIKEKAKSFFATQNRCVTKEDYEARVLNMPSKFGSVAKAYVTRSTPNVEGTTNLTELNDFINNTTLMVNSLQSLVDSNEQVDLQSGINQLLLLNQNLFTPPDISDIARELELGTINIYILGYNGLKQLIGNPKSNTTLTNDSVPGLLKNNIKRYLENFRLLTDVVTITDGYIVNFGVIFDIIAEKYADKQQVKLKCIQKIKDYFQIEKMQFNQPIYKSQLDYELMGIEGVRSIGHVTITQKDDYNSNISDADLELATYTYANIDGEYKNAVLDINGGLGTSNYGFKYDFETAVSDDGNIIVPPSLDTPTVFELKNPNINIQGRVR